MRARLGTVGSVLAGLSACWGAPPASPPQPPPPPEVGAPAARAWSEGAAAVSWGAPPTVRHVAGPVSVWPAEGWPAGAHAVVVDDALWLPVGDLVVRVVPATGRAEVVRAVPGLVDVAAWEGRVWALAGAAVVPVGGDGAALQAGTVTGVALRAVQGGLAVAARSRPAVVGADGTRASLGAWTGPLVALPDGSGLLAEQGPDAGAAGGRVVLRASEDGWEQVAQVPSGAAVAPDGAWAWSAEGGVRALVEGGRPEGMPDPAAAASLEGDAVAWGRCVPRVGPERTVALGDALAVVAAPGTLSLRRADGSTPWSVSHASLTARAWALGDDLVLTARRANAQALAGEPGALVWSRARLEVLAEVAGVVDDAALGPDGPLVVTGGRIDRVDPATGARSELVNTGEGTQVRLSRDGRFALVEAAGHVERRRLEDGAVMAVYDLPFTGRVTALGPAARWIFVEPRGGAPFLHDMIDGERVAAAPRAWSVRDDGALLVSAGPTVRLPDGRRVTPPRGTPAPHHDPPRFDGQVVVWEVPGAAGFEALRWDPATGAVARGPVDESAARVTVAWADGGVVVGAHRLVAWADGDWVAVGPDGARGRDRVGRVQVVGPDGTTAPLLPLAEVAPSPPAGSFVACPASGAR